MSTLARLAPILFNLCRILSILDLKFSAAATTRAATTRLRYDECAELHGAHQVLPSVYISRVSTTLWPRSTTDSPKPPFDILVVVLSDPNRLHPSHKGMDMGIRQTVLLT